LLNEELTPREIVGELDKYIIGQNEAKRCVAVALRNRYRRKLLPSSMQDEITPKNIIMIGPTGVGKTEIARRLANLVSAPFVKVEATKFTEVGYVGRDVESMVRDLVETSIRIVQNERMQAVDQKAAHSAEERLVEILVPLPKKREKSTNPLGFLFSSSGESDGSEETDIESEDAHYRERLRRAEEEREIMREKLKRQELEERLVEIEVDDKSSPMLEVFSGQGMDEMGINLQDIFGNLLPSKKKKKKVPVKDARQILKAEEAQKMIDMDAVNNEAIERSEQLGIIFLDEVDKIAGKEYSGGADVSREGVQRDILPIVEGSTVITKYGPVKTDHMLFIAAGAFNISQPADLIPELQGRFPIRVELESLSMEDFVRILKEPQNALLKQYTALLQTEGLEIEFKEEGIAEISRIATRVNEDMENIGARRLHTIMEKLLEEISFEAPEKKGDKIIIDAPYVQNKLRDIVQDKDLSKYIL